MKPAFLSLRATYWHFIKVGPRKDILHISGKSNSDNSVQGSDDSGYSRTTPLLLGFITDGQCVQQLLRVSHKVCLSRPGWCTSFCCRYWDFSAKSNQHLRLLLVWHKCIMEVMFGYLRSTYFSKTTCWSPWTLKIRHFPANDLLEYPWKHNAMKWRK